MLRSIEGVCWGGEGEGWSEDQGSVPGRGSWRTGLIMSDGWSAYIISLGRDSSWGLFFILHYDYNCMECLWQKFFCQWMYSEWQGIWPLGAWKMLQCSIFHRHPVAAVEGVCRKRFFVSSTPIGHIKHTNYTWIICTSHSLYTAVTPWEKSGILPLCGSTKKPVNESGMKRNISLVKR